MKKLHGPEIPDNFVTDGCSMSPDMFWRPACVVHDYEYHLIRAMERKWKRVIGRAKYAMEHGNAKQYDLEIARAASLKGHIKDKRKTADRHLKQNMKICADKTGRGMFFARRWARKGFALCVSRFYYRGVRIFGMEAIRGKGHAGNV